MKNLIIFNIPKNGIEKYKKTEIENYLKCQVDNSLYFGWKPEDIIIGTNFKFEHNGIKNIRLYNVCEYNPNFNFYYGLNELFIRFYIDDDIWLHDHDVWQINEFEFPIMYGHLGGCNYVRTQQWNGGSIFVKRNSEHIIKYIVDFHDVNFKLFGKGEEKWLVILRNNMHSDIQKEFTTLNTTYNVGVTYFEDRYMKAIKPVKISGFKPNKKSDREKVSILIDKRMKNLFTEHNLW